MLVGHPKREPDALSSEQIEDAIASPRPLRWWAPVMWWSVLGLALTVGGLWVWRDADTDLARDSDPRLVSTPGVVQSPAMGGGSYRRGSRTMIVQYTFQVGGMTYVGSRISPFDGLSVDNNAALSRMLTVGASVMVKYDPQDPSINFIDAAAMADLSQERATAQQNRIIGFLLAIVGVGVLCWSGWTFQSLNAARQRDRDN